MSVATTELSIESLKRHIGRRLVSTDVVHPGAANQLRLTFGRPEAELALGDPLPPGWHVLYFLPRVAPDGLRPDGSPIDSGVIPPMPLPRRMFAGQQTRFHRPIRIGDAVRRETELMDVALKTGSTGTLVFTTVVDRVFTPEGLALEEERRGVFREEVKAGEQNAAPRREAAPSEVPWRRSPARSSAEVGRQLVERHPGLDLLVPAAGPHVDHQPVGALVLAVDLAAPLALGGAGRLERGARLLEVVHVEANVVDALGGRALAQVRRVVAAVLEDREVDVPVAQPDALRAGVGRHTTELGQAEDTLVEVGGLRGIIGR